MKPEPLYWMITYNGKPSSNIFETEREARRTMDMLHFFFKPDTRDVVPLYEHPKDMKNIVKPIKNNWLNRMIFNIIVSGIASGILWMGFGNQSGWIWVLASIAFFAMMMCYNGED